MKRAQLCLAIIVWMVLGRECRAQHALLHVGSPEGEHNAGKEQIAPDFSESTRDVFVATDSWQEIKPGQAVPKGLHIRINMETGKKEAKLLDQPGQAESKPIPASMNPEVLKEALKNIKSDFANTERVSAENLRTYEELKQDLKELEMNIRTDYEVMKSLVESYTSASSDEERSEAVESLEFYVHQYDNAVDFVSMNGLETIVKPSLNATSERLRAMACFLVGSAAQSNPKVQIACLEAGLVNIMLKLIALDPSAMVSLKAFYALSALLRHFPEAQHSFLVNGGLDILKQVLEREDSIHYAVEGAGASSLYGKLKIKILTLINDLLEERRSIDLNSDHGHARLSQYTRDDIDRMLKETGWCQVFQAALVLPSDNRRARRDDMLSTMSEEYPVRAEHDNLEKILAAMLQMQATCGDHFRSSQELMKKLSTLSDRYKELSEKEGAQEDSDTYFGEIFQMLAALVPPAAQQDRLKTEL